MAYGSANSSCTGLRLAAAALVLAALLTGTGCVRRRLTVRSFPPGAQVFVDDQEIGSTPCSAAFVYYGKRKIMLVKDGYRTETFYQALDPPWYEYPPLDFVSENLWLSELRDERVIDVRLVPQETVSPQDLLGRAGALRENARLGILTAPPKLPPGAALAQPVFQLPGQGLPGGKPVLYPGGPLTPQSGDAPRPGVPAGAASPPLEGNPPATPPPASWPATPAFSPAVAPTIEALPPLAQPPGGAPLVQP